MNDIVTRFEENPLLSPKDLTPSREGLTIACLLNPGVFIHEGKICLVVRVAERPEQNEFSVSFPILKEDGTTEIKNIHLNDADLIATDARVIRYKGSDYLTTLSHLRVLASDDGIHFHESARYPPIYGKGALESFGVEDCRVSQIEETYYLTYTAVSPSGVGVGLKTTKDWVSFQSHGLILPPHNKDCAIFEEKINGMFYALHRPSSMQLGGNYIWLAESPDGLHWGNHQCIARTRENGWENARIGGGASPIKTPEGWIVIYHGANEHHQYSLGALLLDVKDPSLVLARTHEPIMAPTQTYEKSGFFGNVVFTNGHVRHADQDKITIYYGASDEFVCGGVLSISDLFKALEQSPA